MLQWNKDLLERLEENEERSRVQERRMLSQEKRRKTRGERREEKILGNKRRIENGGE